MDQPVTAFVHVHYPEIWRAISAAIAARLDFPFHLVVTHSEAVTDIPAPMTPHLVAMTALKVENRGRDIRPFLHALARTPDFDIGLKLHTKKSPQRQDGDQWLAAILDSLLPPGGVAPVIARLRADPRIGLVAPAGFCLGVDPWIDAEAPGMIRVMASLGQEIIETDLDDTYFAAGSMFWFRRSSLEILADDGVLALFEAERGQRNRTTAHALERLFPVVARRLGYLSCAMPALMASRPTDSADDLRELARRYANIPNRYFPGPGLPALPPGSPDPAPSGAIGAPTQGVGRRRSNVIRALLRLPPAPKTAGETGRA